MRLRRRRRRARPVVAAAFGRPNAGRAGPAHRGQPRLGAPGSPAARLGAVATPLWEPAATARGDSGAAGSLPREGSARPPGELAGIQRPVTTVTGESPVPVTVPRSSPTCPEHAGKPPSRRANYA